MSKAVVIQPCPDFYTVGGTMRPTAPSYILRAADTQLLEAVRQCQFCYILTPRQMGKSSLMVRTATQLQETGIRSVIIDLTSIGTTDLTAEAWYLGQIHRIVRQLRLRVDYLSWWKQRSHLGVVQRFMSFLTEVMLNEVAEPVVIFVDEIDTTLSLPDYSDDYFAAIRALYNDRSSNSELERLTFVLLGVASPSDLIKDPQRTPFNIGTRVELTDFTLEEAQPLITGLAPDPDLAVELLTQVFVWTAGHPYLTQKACARIAQWAQSEWEPADVPIVVDDLVNEMFLSEAGRHTDDNLRFIRDRILETTESKVLLRFYRWIRQGEVLSDNELDPIQVMLKLSGLIKATDAGVLKVRNAIYERVFDEPWIRVALSEREPQPGPAPEFTYDVFVSYSHRDRSWVLEYLLPRLEAAELRVAIDFRDFEPGLPSLVNMERAVENSRHTLVVLTPAWVASEWTTFESLLVQTSDPASVQRRLLPVMLKQVAAPKRIAMLTYADFTHEDDREDQLERLLWSLGAPQQVELIEKNVQPISRPPVKYNTGTIRQLLDAAFGDEELTTFCFDYFRDVYKAFSAGMSRQEKIQRLIEYAEKKILLDDLLDHIAQLNPRAYRRFASQLETRE
jgi:hypothetical protein